MRGWNLKRWIALALGIGIALGAGTILVRSATRPREAPPAESISATSRAQLDDVIRKAGAGEPQR
jgi:demethoxyubiquinone hydroxylase (CLK1/Coq7/Cat5 family)